MGSIELFKRLQQYYETDEYKKNKLKFPPNNQIIGVVCVMRVRETGKILYVIEKESKPWFDKEPKDTSPFAGGREKLEWVREEGLEAIMENLKREVRQESGIQREEYEIDPIPIGFYHFKSTPIVQEKFPISQYPQGPWIVAFESYISEKNIKNREHIPEDDETTGPYVGSFSKNRLSKIPIRGAMRGILQDALAGNRWQVRTASRGKHIRK